MLRPLSLLGAALVVSGTTFACGGSEPPASDTLSVGGSGTARGGSGAATGGSSTGGSSTGGSSTGGSGATAARGGTGGATGVGGSTVSGDACPGVPVDDADAGAGIEACQGVSYEAEAVPVDLYLMMDRSISLANVDPTTGVARWDALRDAIATFVDDAADQDLRMGLGFFGRSGGNDDALDCDADYYASPKVEIAKLSTAAGPLIDAMTSVRPGGFTPTGPALEGALRHASEWAENAPGHAVAVVLITDGYPTQCDPRGVGAIAELAASARGVEPYVRTFVIGLAAEYNLDGIARSGGTHQAYRVDEGNAAASFLQALRTVSNSKLACQYEVPSPPGSTMSIDFDEVRVTYTTADGVVEEVPRINDYSACGRNPNGGWYYDDPEAPSQILVCPCTCSRFDAGRVDVALGCKPRIGLR